MAYRDVVLADSPVDYYEMSTGTGTDSGSGGRTLTLSGPTTGVAGKVGNGWSFDGVNDYASMGTFPSLTTAFSFEAWVKTNVAGLADTPTVIRRDGTDIVLLRVRGSGTGVNPGQAEVYIDGTTLLSGSSFRVDDGNWHHLVYTQSGNAAKLYVDGVQRATATTAQSTFNFGSGTAYIGAAGGTTELYKGTLDEVAVYNTALSATRVQAHYDAAAAVNGGYTAQAMTASTTNPDAVGQGNVRTIAVTEDSYVWGSGPNTNYGSDTSLKRGGGYLIYAKVPTITPDSGYAVTDVKLVLTRIATHTSAGYTVSRNTSDWSEGTLTYNNKPSDTALGGTVTDPGGATGEKWILDIDDVLSQTNYGLNIGGGNQRDFASSEHATTAYRPYIEYTLVPQQNASYNAQVATASATLPDPTVDATDTVSASGQPLTASALIVDPNVTITGDRILEAEEMQSFVDMPGGSWSGPRDVFAEVITASAEAVDPDIDVQVGAVVTAQPFEATAAWRQPTSVNDNPIVQPEGEDNYFLRVFAEAPKMWFRLNDTGSLALDRMGGYDGIYHNVGVGQFNGPDSRHSVHFDGTASIEQEEPAGTNVDEALMTSGRARSTLEFSFRTSKANSFLMVTRDATSNPTTLTQTANAPRELYLRDGKISLRAHFYPNSLGKKRDPYEFTGFRNLADNEWHSVVIKGYKTLAGEEGVEIWVDGKFEVRRTEFSGAVPLLGFPDWIGSRPDTVDGDNIGALPSTLNFVGDMSEVVFYDHLVSDHEIARHFYDFMGWNPIEASPMEAFAFTPADHKGKGNQKRALVLDWYAQEDGYSIGGDGWNNKMNFNPVAGQGTDFSGYKLFRKSVDDNNGQSYRDPVTDVPTLIDLEHDVDIDDYDVIMFSDWPDEGSEMDDINLFFPGAYERLLTQLRWANNRGVGLFVTHPRLAVDLGIVDRVEFVSTLEENAYTNSQGNAFGLYDYGSAAKFPWNISASVGLQGWAGTGSMYSGEAMNANPNFLSGKAFFYGDTNKNDRFRVRATIEGLTDIPSYMIQDAIYHKDYDIYGWQSAAFKYLHRLDGLHIGDEFIFHGTDFGQDYDAVSADFTDVRLGRWFGYYATPLANVKAGTVVTTFGAKHWKGTSEVDNPYKDYATTIVLQPGDSLKGTPVGGKIYVNFTEQPSRQPEAVAIQVLPEDDEDFPATYRPDTDEQRQWEWSETRKSLANTGNQESSTLIQVVMPNNETIGISVGSGGGANLSMTRSTNLFPIEWQISWQMNRRGLYWLMDRPEQAEGDNIQRVTPVEATGSMPNPSVVAERDADTSAPAFVALAQMPKVAEDSTGDVDIVTLPLTASVEFTGYSKVIGAAPMVAEAELVENFDMVHATGEQVVLTLHGVDATLYLKEEV